MVSPITAGSSTTVSAPALGGSAALGWAGLGADIVGGAWGAYASAEAARDQWKHQKKMMQKRYQWQVADMKAAGLNPMLSVAQGAPGAPTAAQMSRENPFKGVARDAISAVMLKRQMENMDASTENMLAQAASSTASARKANADASVIEQFGPQQAEAGLALNASTISRMEQEIKNLQAAGELTRQNVENNKVLQPLVNKYQAAVAKAAELDIPLKEADAKFWATLPEASFLKQLAPLIRMIVK